jgi:NADH:ubiquinone oxidoreductase subunit 4 (subunit M)
MATIPFFSTCIFLALCINFSIPPILSIFRELIIISRLINFSSLSSLVVGLSIFLSCYYCLILFSQITFGKEQRDDDEFEIVDPFQYFNIIFFFFIIVRFIFLLINKIC